MKHFRHISIAQLFACLLLTGILSSCGNNNTPGEKPTAIDIPYPQPYPDSTALVFLPGIVSADSLDFNAAFSPDGKSCYFSRSMNKQSKIYVTRYDGTKWTAPTLISPVATSYSDADPAFGPDSNLYFISNRPKDPSDTIKDYDIWFSTPLANGSWSDPVNLNSVNSDSNEFYVSFTEKGNLYFASSRQGGLGEEDIYVSKLVNRQYTTPENLGAAINSSKSEYDPFISAQEDLLIFTSSNRDDSFGGADLYCSKPGTNQQWQQAAHLGKNINTSTRDFCPYFSPDSRYFFFSSDRNVKWISAAYVKQQIDKFW